MYIIHCVSKVTVIVALCSLIACEAQNPCRQPNGNAGSCITLNSCRPLSELNKKSQMTENDLLYLRQASCGVTASFKPKVCCPPEEEWNVFTRVKPVELPIVSNIYVAPNKPVGVSTTVDNEEYPVSELCPPSLTPPSINSECCGMEVASTGDRIMSGETAAADQFPWLALLEYNGGYTVCGGTLISSRYVLTAAHCVATTRYGPVTKVRLGEYNTTSYPIDVVESNGGGFENVTVYVLAVEKQTRHPSYVGSTQGAEHDIGLIKLTKNAPYNEFVRPICLPSVDFTRESRPGKRLVVAGWGSNGLAFSEVKQFLSVPYVPLETCRRSYAERITQNQVCAGGEKGRDSCKGDSGGPLMTEENYTFVLVGVISYGHTNCGTEGVAAVHTNVYQYLDWIRKEMT